jgi:hypothetical protein
MLLPRTETEISAACHQQSRARNVRVRQPILSSSTNHERISLLMRILRRIVVRLAVLILSCLCLLPVAQAQQDNGAGAAGCFACSGFLVFLLIAGLVLNIALLVWVARDAKARGMDSAILWMLLVMFTGPLGLVIYLFTRPQGNMIQCPNCQNKRLQASIKCPHCGIGA